MILKNSNWIKLKKNHGYKIKKINKIVMKLKNSNCDKTKKIVKKKTSIVKKYDKAQNLKL